MNIKQIAPLVTTLAPTLGAALPPLLLIGGGVALLVWLLSDDKEKKPESVPASASHTPSTSGGNSVQNRSIPPNFSGKPTVMPAPAIVPAISAPAIPKIPVPPLSAIPAVKIIPKIPLLPKKKFITREDLTKIFNDGRGRTRKSAVAALKALGFGKTAAYEALAINGRFSAWLQFAPDGIITWTD